MNAPTLLIGLGGTGCKIVERVANMVTNDQLNNIAFAVFDTDINDLEGIKNRNPFIKVIQTSTKQTVGEYLNKDINARDTWFPVNAILNGKTLTEGAGQVRSISRLALETVIRAGKMEPLHEAIQSLYKVEEDKVEQALRVVIVSSLAGGTGSGLILPVALYTRNYLKTHFRQSANITRGFFILPEVFFEVIVGQTERNNLKSNAYATLRELDAFLMKGDATLPDKYRDSVRMEFPRVASQGYEEYDVRPYDFCFLFDAQNAEGGKLNSFDQYLDHAANCIYAQSIGPMNKRSNSSEDNTIRKLAAERGRNRYAGAGASMMIYPVDDICNLVAMNWAKQCVSRQWLVYDNMYKEMRREDARKRDSGLIANDQTITDFYVAQIESDAKHDDGFAKAIINTSGRYEDKIIRIADKWVEYVGAIEDKVMSDITDAPLNVVEKKEKAIMVTNGLGTDWEDYPGAYQTVLEYKRIFDAYVEESARSVAFSMFKGSQNLNSSKSNYDDVIKKDGKPFNLETYLVDSAGNFLHPNAIRYLLIKIKELMISEKANVDNEVKNSEDFFNNFERTTFDDPKSDDEDGSVHMLADRKTSLTSKLTKRPSGDQEDIKKKILNLITSIEEYHGYFVKSIVMQQGIQYISSIIEALETFYTILETKIETLDRRIDDIYKKYKNSKGTTVRYVCASPKCLDHIYNAMPYTGSAITIDSELSEKIYSRVLVYATSEEKLNSNRFFNNLFEDGILGYFRKSVLTNYGTKLDVDILDALEKEIDYEEMLKNKENTYEQVNQLVSKIIDDTRKLSCPFIESPMGEAREPIDSCTFNDSLKPERGDDSPRAQLIRKELMNFGGEPDKDIPRNKIMFYQSFYGLRANDLSKFAPPERSATYNRSGGEYFKAYYELIDGINPETHRSKEISPHIDRWWHIVTKMPDLDEANQKRQEYEIYAAFFWALMNDYIYREVDASDQKIYKIRERKLGLDDDRLVVSNGTPCDKLYEVLDAIAIYPELVQKIREKSEETVMEDLNAKNSFEDSSLFVDLKNFKIEEPGIGPDDEHSSCLFDIPLLMKKSSMADEYNEADTLDMLNVILQEITRYLSNFYSEKDLAEKVCPIIMEQWEKHLVSLEKESRINPNIYKESLFNKVGDTLENYLRSLYLKKEADAVQQKVRSLRSMG